MFCSYSCLPPDSRGYRSESKGNCTPPNGYFSNLGSIDFSLCAVDYSGRELVGHSGSIDFSLCPPVALAERSTGTD